MILKLKRLDKIILFFVIAFIISISLIRLFEVPFDEVKWAQEPEYRYKMIDDLIESQRLMNKSKTEVLQILGLPSSSAIQPKDIFIYTIGDPPSFFESRKEHLLIVFVDQKVNEVTLAFDN